MRVGQHSAKAPSATPAARPKDQTEQTPCPGRADTNSIIACVTPSESACRPRAMSSLHLKSRRSSIVPPLSLHTAPDKPGSHERITAFVSGKIISSCKVSLLARLSPPDARQHRHTVLGRRGRRGSIAKSLSCARRHGKLHGQQLREPSRR